VPNAKVLLVDDDEVVREGIGELLQHYGFDITTAANVPEALKYIGSETFDVLLSDLHMPGAGDGLTVVSAMRHSNPCAVTLLLSGFPEMNAAARAILLQTDEILVKPVDVKTLVDVITQRLANKPAPPRVIEDVATILDRETQSTIRNWFTLVQREESLTAVPLSYEQRCGHLPQVFEDLVRRLRSSHRLGSKELVSIAAEEHGVIRHHQGYTAAMMVDESRMLQLSIFQTLQNNLASIDFSVLLIGVMTVADEVDSQLSQAMASYIAQSLEYAVPA
jgi:YesN/AraC family two-component response regulator